MQDTDMRDTLKSMQQLGPLPAALRKRRLRQLAQAIKSRQSELIAAIAADFSHRCHEETVLSEVFICLEEIRHTLRHMDHWLRARRARAGWKFLTSATAVTPQPLGVVGIMAPWNYPFNLCMVPLVSAIAAGNRVMLKPSEETPQTAALIKDLVESVWPADEARVVLGDVSVASAFSRLPFDHLFFTGSTQVGRIVMQNAAHNLTPVTLELGGKSPAIVADDYPLKAAARAIVGGKFFNAGQTCIAPDYVLIGADRLQALQQQLLQEMRRQYPEYSRNPDYSCVVNARHQARLHALLDGLAPDQLHSPFSAEAAVDERKFRPMLVTGLSPQHALLQEEIFGPILPLVAVPSLDAAIEHVNAHARPLTLYLFTHKPRVMRRVRENTVSGSMCINETLVQFAQENLPFGGVGDSGMGRYHGETGVLAMSHLKSVYYQSRLNFNGLTRAPFTRIKKMLIKFL